MFNVYSSDMCMVICTFTNLNTNACDQKKLILMIVLSYLKLLTINMSFVSITCISHCPICFSKRLSVAVNEIFVHVHALLPHLFGLKMPLSKGHKCGGEYNIPRKFDIVGLICSISMH